MSFLKWLFRRNTKSEVGSIKPGVTCPSCGRATKRGIMAQMDWCSWCGREVNPKQTSVKAGAEDEKCDVCGTLTAYTKGFILTTAEVTSSRQFWSNQLSKYKPFLRLMTSPEQRSQYLAQQIAELALNSTGWPVCKKCSRLFQFNQSAAKHCASHRTDRTDGGPADIEVVKQIVLPLVNDTLDVEMASEQGSERIPIQHRVGNAPTGMKKYFKCRGCGAIVPKGNAEDLEFYELWIETRVPLQLSSGITCDDCGTRHDLEDVLIGKFDMKSSDSLIDQMISDRANVDVDRKTRTWWYRGKKVE